MILEVHIEDLADGLACASSITAMVYRRPVSLTFQRVAEAGSAGDAAIAHEQRSASRVRERIASSSIWWPVPWMNVVA